MTNQVDISSPINVTERHHKHGRDPTEEDENCCTVRRLLDSDVQILGHLDIRRIDQSRAHWEYNQRLWIRVALQPW